MMENDLRVPLIASFVLHISVFFFTSFHHKKPVYIVVPVEMFYYSPPALVQPEKIGGAFPQKKEEAVAAKKEVIAVKKKDVIKKKEPEKKKVEEKDNGKKDDGKKDDGKKDQSKAAQDTAAQPGGEESTMPLRPSSNISIDAVRFPYTYYTNQIVKKISQNWQWSSDFGRLTTIIYFKISKTGSVSEVFVKQSSGDNLFDSQAVRAVKLADPFPPLPFGYEDNELGIYFEFSFKE